MKMFVCARKQYYLCAVKKRNNDTRSDARNVKV